VGDADGDEEEIFMDIGIADVLMELSLLGSDW